MHLPHCIYAKLVYRNFVVGEDQNQKKRDLLGGPLKKSYAGLRGVWIAGRILYAGSLLLIDSSKNFASQQKY